MQLPVTKAAMGRLASEYGMAGVLVLLALLFCVVTNEEQNPTGANAGAMAAAQARAGERVLIVSDADADGTAFAEAARSELASRGARVAGEVTGGPADIRRAIDTAGPAQLKIVTTAKIARLAVIADRPGVTTLTAAPYRWPVFLRTENLLNIVNQVVVIALLAAGMTLVIITGGIDLSVGSLVALSAVISAIVIRHFGGASAGAGAMVLGACAGVLACLASGLISGTFITLFRLPPFIATLGMMQVASGLAFLASQGESIHDIPLSFTWLGRGTSIISGLPNAVVLMILVYTLGHLLMNQTTIGRFIYAVGGNREASRLCGVPVPTVLLFAYAVSGALSGLGGVVVASQLKTGAPTYGNMYELQAIAAVVVGGTSLAGGSGRILGTLIGVLIIAVIQNGMNLTGVESYLQKVVLGLVILAAVTIDMGRQGAWSDNVLGRAIQSVRGQTRRRSKPRLIESKPDAPVGSHSGINL